MCHRSALRFYQSSTCTRVRKQTVPNSNVKTLTLFLLVGVLRRGRRQECTTSSHSYVEFSTRISKMAGWCPTGTLAALSMAPKRKQNLARRAREESGSMSSKHTIRSAHTRSTASVGVCGSQGYGRICVSGLHAGLVLSRQAICVNSDFCPQAPGSRYEVSVCLFGRFCH